MKYRDVTLRNVENASQLMDSQFDARNIDLLSDIFNIDDIL